MNQKNIFTLLAVFGLLWSVSTYIMGEQIATDCFDGLDEKGVFAVSIANQLVAAVNLIVVLALFATRNHSNVAWAFALGLLIMGIGSLKHLFLDGVHVPIIGIAMQFVFAAACGYLWLKERQGAVVTT
ncbi:MAG: hypothetical protein R3D58_01655 [Saprospiraceae bacterium]|jgi:hypothetical protein|nr:hypothetical protein [Lewinellaceae bacterium]